MTTILCLKEAESTCNYNYTETSWKFQKKSCNTEGLAIFILVITYTAQRVVIVLSMLQQKRDLLLLSLTAMCYTKVELCIRKVTEDF